MKKIAFIASSLVIALTLTACSSTKTQPVAGNQNIATNVTPTTTATETQNQKQNVETPKSQQSTPVSEQPKTQIDYAFTRDNQHPEKVLIDIINGAKSNLDIAIYSLTNKEIVKAIQESKKRGVAIRIITDEQEAKNATQAADLKSLKATGIPIKKNTHKGLMHLKVTIADKSVLTTGSFNYSASAATINDEVLVAIYDSKMAQEWDSEFEKMWTDTRNFQDIK